MKQITKGTLIVALDGMDHQSVLSMVSKLDTLAKTFRANIWVKLHNALDQDGVIQQAIKMHHPDIGLWADMKLFDIPTTVALRVKALGKYADAVSVHLAGGHDMVMAAKEAGQVTDTRIIGISHLSSTAKDDPLYDVSMMSLVKVASDTGVHAIVGNPMWYGGMLDERIHRIMAGIRPASHTTDDHQAPPTPGEAIHVLGASAIVVGRPITKAADPFAMTANILEAMAKVPTPPDFIPKEQPASTADLDMRDRHGIAPPGRE